jgi:uncharacterized membrane protein YphA (DoxX/SURF4 family)
MRILSEPLAWIVVLRVACGLWFFASGVRKANRDGIGRLIPGELFAYVRTAPRFYARFLEVIAIPHARVFALLVVAGEMAAGAGLAAGLLTNAAAIVGIFLNANYLLAAGRGNHGEQAQNGAMILVQLSVLATGAGRVAGLDELLFGPR